ncbi:hypothetical protein HRbin07_00217 [bacterium HR07]|nr:hypothetical protein HRbin07_00217 [bacterium HR07]
MRKRFLVIGVILSAIVGGAMGWLWWALGPGASSSTTALLPVPPLPAAPSSAPAPEPSAPSASPDVTVPVGAGVIDAGTLTVEARGQRLGTEEYTLERRENGELVLRSQGTLAFKIAFFNVQATFVQVMTFTAQRRPISYQLALHGPIGIGNRRVSASFGATAGTVNDGERQTEIALPEEPFLLLGMFSSYAILPLWAKPDAPQKLKVISLRGDRRDQGELWVLVEHVGPVQMRGAQGALVQAEEYLLRGERLTLTLYLSGERFLALQNDTHKRDESFRLYRSDLFPHGLDLISSQN